MLKDNKIFVAKSDKELYLLPNMANRHGLIAGATGTGKTITMKVLAESFSSMGVPVFFSDVKGDLSGMLQPGVDSESMQKRLENFGIKDSFEYISFPTRFWDIFGEKGHPVRVTITDMGPMLLSNLLNLSEVQSGVLNIVFKVADEHGLPMLDFKDLRSMLQYVGDNREEFTTAYGNVSAASIGAIQRALLTFESEGGTDMFGEPDLDIRDWMRTDFDGRGYINILSSQRLIGSPTVYATFLLWMVSELLEKLPEVGDPDKPRMVFFFDEAHLIFESAPKALLQKITQMVKLIRSKGVGIYFVTQSPSDIPDEVLAQLSNRIQHCLRAYTPNDQKAVRAAARSFRVNPSFDTEKALMELGVGEALVSFLDDDGIPGVVERAKILPPQSLMGPAGDELIRKAIESDEMELKYRQSIDRESAYELIMAAKEVLKKQQEEETQAKLEEKAAQKEAAAAEKQAQKEAAAAEKAAQKAAAAAEKQAQKEAAAKQKAAEKQAAKDKKVVERAMNNAASTVSGALTRNIINSMTGGKTTDGATIAKRAAINALSSVARSTSKDLMRGLFGNKL